jgi:4-hydroxythreonine-4-phosphate dehydrogenase
MAEIKRLLLTPGEPAGIGPDLIIQIAQQPMSAELVVIADPDLLTARAKQLDLPLRLIFFQPDKKIIAHEPGTLTCCPISLADTVTAGQLNIKNAGYVIQTLSTAASLCRANKAHAMVTGPVHKGIINEAGIIFSGHTEFFSEQCGQVPTVMLFVSDVFKVALLTTHVPLKEVPHHITENKLKTVIQILQKSLQEQFAIKNPRLLIAGLNPHAGEQGYLGREEIDTIIPVLNELRNKGQILIGPLPADTLFTPKTLQQADAVLAMYHDQALPVVKYASFGHAVNVTLGLPFIRTSVDHGTALDIAGTGQADAGSMRAAVQLAMQLR